VRRNFIPLLVFLAALIGLGGAYATFQSTVRPRYEGAHEVLNSRSELRVSMTVRHDDGPISQEEYRMSDVDGLSKSRYRALGRNGLAITIDERPRVTIEEGPNVAFLFQQTVLDGIWELPSRPPRGDTSTHYTIEVYQLTGDQHGSHRFEFTDPHYWATTGGHQFHITLDKNKPVPNLLTLSSTTLVEPRYEKLVADFREFGPQSFRDKVAAAQTRLRGHG
jgi:hypothetical protein